MSIQDNFSEVRYFTDLDVYTTEVDNRPLKDIVNNIGVIANAIDSSSGSSNRAATSAAYVAMGVSGLDSYVGDYVQIGNSLSIEMRQGFGVFNRTVTHAGVTYDIPELAIHDKVTQLTDILPASNPGSSWKYLVQATAVDSVPTDRISGFDSVVKNAVLTVKNSSQFATGSIEPALVPDAGNIPVMEIIVPYGATNLSDATVRLVNMKTIKQASDVQGSTRVDYVYETASLNAGDRTINLNNTALSVADSTSIEVFVDGVNQFDWTYNVASGLVTLGAALSAPAEVRVRQAKIIRV